MIHYYFTMIKSSKIIMNQWFLDIDEKAINTAQIFEINKQQFRKQNTHNPIRPRAC